MSMSSNVMRETFKLPKLPGNGFQEEMMKKTFKKKQMMQPATGPKLTGVERIPVDFEAIKIAAENAGDTASGVPVTSLTLDRKVLRFTAYFKEGVHESHFETERVRRCIVYYYLEDDTISVSEPREDNAGMSQGCMLKRHQIPKPDGGFFSYEDFNVGSSMLFYGKCFQLSDCDPFTRNFLTSLGLEVPEAQSFPSDAYQTLRARPARKERDPEDRHLVAVMECFYSGKRSRLSPEELKAAKKFLLNDRKVLKFRARWDDSSALYGDDRRFTLYYFLADDTIEVTEDLPVNAGRDPFPSFVRRRKCAKAVQGKKFENPKASLSFKNEDQECYTDVDLYVGAIVEVFGRRFELISCDDFTATYLHQFHDRSDSTTINVDGPPSKPKQKPIPPPYNGYGDEDDSLGSWKNLVLKPPKKNVKQYIENSGAMLKYRMKMDTPDPASEVRRFVLTYYLADDTISIYEPSQRNSGIIGGKFLQRRKVKHSNTGVLCKAADLFIGAKIEINNHKFILYATDEKSLAHMELNGGKFEFSNINVIMMKLCAMLLSSQTNLEAVIKQADQDCSGGVDYVELSNVFVRLGLPISEHEVLTLLRYLDVNRDGSVTYDELLYRILPEGANSMDRSWEAIFQEMKEESNMEDSLDKQEVSQHSHHESTTAAHAATFLLDKYAVRRALFNNAFRNETDYSVDGKIGEKEFEAVVNGRLKLDFDKLQMSCLSKKLFQSSCPRFDYNEMLRIVQGTSLHNATMHSIAAYVKK